MSRSEPSVLPLPLASSEPRRERATRAGAWGRWVRQARSVATLAGALGLCVAATGCGRTSAEEHGTAVTPSPRRAAAADSPIAAFEARRTARGLEVIEAAEDGRVLAGRRRAAPERSSAKLVYDAALFDARGERLAAALPDGVQDARFAPAPARRLAVLGADDVLRIYEPPHDQPVRIADGVFPGFAFSHDARSIAFARGQAPELYATCLELETGVGVELTSHGNPVWGFAFSPDDSRIAFVDSREGHPSLMTVDRAGGSLTKLTHRELRPGDPLAGRLAPFPDGRRPPLWTTTGLWIEDHAGVHALDGQGSVLVSRAGAADLHRGSAPGVVLFREGGLMWRVP